MDKICSTPLWDPNVTYAKYPDFTPCFQKSFAFWIPCLILWTAAPFRVIRMRKGSGRRLKLTWLTYCKLLICALLILTELFDFAYDLNFRDLFELVDYITTIVLILSYVLISVITFYEIKFGFRSSVLQFCFWGSHLLFLAFLVRSKILELNKAYGQIDYTIYATFFQTVLLVLLAFVLTLFSEERLHKEKISSANFLKPFPEKEASILSRITFWWLNPLIMGGFNKVIDREDMWRIEDKEACRILTEKIEEEWTKVSGIYIKLSKAYRKDFLLDIALRTAEEQEALKKAYKSPYKEPSLLFCLLKVFHGRFINGAFLKLIHDLSQFVGPIILAQLIEFTKEKDQSTEIGYFFSFVLLFASIIQTTSLQHYFNRMYTVGARVRTSLMGLIYRKSMRLSPKARGESTTGEMINIMQINTQTLLEIIPFLNLVWSAPLQIAICILMLWQYLQAASFTSVVVIILCLPLNALVSKALFAVSKKKLRVQDKRVKLTNEMISGIKVIKLNAWEFSFQELIEKLRLEEMGFLKRKAVYVALITFISGCMSFFAASLSFLVYLLDDSRHVLDAKTAFVCLTLFNLIKQPLLILPTLLNGLVLSSVAMSRIQSFLLREEIDEAQISYTPDKENVINYEQVDLGWTENQSEKCLTGINLKIKHGELVAVVGKVGSGKSSLLNSLFGEMVKFRGTINLDGSFAYVPQQAWLQNSSLRDNILFGRPFNEEEYSRVIKECSLAADINILSSGDQTEIGENGINLSGGQKQRISLARTVYSNSDINVLDDPLSAVDTHVAKHIFDYVIGPNGSLKNKTRLFATNSLSFLPECDKIIMLKGGTVHMMGTYEELVKDEEFSSFIGEYLKQNDQDKENGKIPESKGSNENIKTARTSLIRNELSTSNIIVKETVEIGNVKLATLFEYIKASSITHTLFFYGALLLSCVANSGSGFWLSYWSNQSESNQGFDSMLGIGVYTVIGVSQYLLQAVSDLIFVRLIRNSAQFFHQSMLASILRSGMGFFESTPVGRIMNRFSKDVEAVEEQIPTSYVQQGRLALTLLMTIFTIIILDVYFIIPLVPIMVVYIVCQRYYVRSMRQLRRLNSVYKSPIFSHFGETLSGITTIRSFRAEHRFIKMMEEKIDTSLSFFYPDFISIRWLGMRLEFLGSLVAFCACIFAVIGRDTSSSGQTGLSISFALSVSQLMNILVRASADFESNITSVERIKEYCRSDNHEAEWTIESSKPDSEWPSQGKIEFKDYSVKYREDLDNVLKNITCTINLCEKIGVVGRTGAGKSSLVLALLRILESKNGAIHIDGIDISSIGLHDLRHKLTVIFQDPVLFSGTVKMNVDPFNEYSDQQIWDALDKTHLKDCVMKLDRQLLFECFEGGENFSVGQRQLLCLARALLRKSRILILDEATAAIDHNTDDLVQATIRSAFIDCTVITIAHRLNTIMDSTRIMVLDKGEIVEFDTPESLLQDKRTIFYSMASSAKLV